MVANIALFGWPLVVMVLFRTCSRPVALLASIIAGYLLLPTQTELNLPGLPTLNKDTVPAIATFLVVLMVGAGKDQQGPAGWVPRSLLPKILVSAIVIGTFLTVVTNGDALIYGATFVPALRLWDALSAILTVLVSLLPLFLGRRLLARPEHHQVILVALVVAAFLYSFLALYEVRMSPQLNNIIYGFFPHSWLQHIRAGGFRPIVFLVHGLWLAIFFSGAILAAFGLMRLSTGNLKVAYLGAGLWLLMTLVLAKSLGALAITLLLLPIVVFSPVRIQLLVAAGVAVIVLLYPMLRGANLIPVDQVFNWVQGLSPERAESFGFRLANEDILLEKASERPLFGWGGWGRSFVYDEFGRDISVTDGYWIIVIGIGGWVRYLAEFGLLCLAPILAAWHARHYRIGLETSVLLLILAGNLADLIPNATITPLTWLMAGAIWGRLELGRDVNASPAEIPTPEPERARAAYARRAPEPATPEPEQAGQPAPEPAARQRYTRQKARIRRDRADGHNRPKTR